MKRKPVLERTFEEIIMQTLQFVKWLGPKNAWTILGFVLGILIVFMAVPGCGRPLMVGTKGADVYHRPGCKYAEKSLQKYGDEKRLEYHDYWTVNFSGRRPCPKCKP